MNKIKPAILSTFLFFIFSVTQAQFSNIVVFTQVNEPFFVILNGIQQSPDPETNVKITGLNAPNYKLKVLFENKALPEIDKTVYIQPETEVSYEVLKNSKGIWVLRLLNSIPIDEISEQHNGQEIFIYTTTPRLSTTTVSQTTTISTGGLVIGGTVTTTTTQTTSTIGNQVDYGNSEMGYPEYSGPRGCPRPMNTQSFEQAVESINSKSFESSKLTLAKQVAGSNCLLCRQVKEIMKLFSFESSRLEFAKYAFKYTWDINNYFMLNDAFEFESSIDDLNRYINSSK